MTNVAENESAVTLFLKNINKPDDTGNYNVIPANIGVILATKSAASEIPGARFVARQNYKSYNELVIPMEENGSAYEYEGKDNLLVPLYESQVVPASDENNFNYFFAYYNARIATKMRRNMVRQITSLDSGFPKVASHIKVTVVICQYLR